MDMAMRGTAIRLSIGVVLMLLPGCRNPAPRELPKRAPLAADFRPVIAGCAGVRFRVARLGSDVVVFGLRVAPDHRAHAVVLDPISGRQRVLDAGILDTLPSYQRDAVEEQSRDLVSAYDRSFAEGAPRLDGSSWDSFRVSVQGSCAPDLTNENGPIVCSELEIRVSGPLVSSKVAAVATGELAGMPPRGPAPEGWEKDVAALQRREPNCLVEEWRAMTPDLVFADAARAPCSFGAGAILARGDAGLKTVVATRGEDDNLVVAKASGSWWVGWGVDRHVEQLWRASNAKLEPVAMPMVDGAADDMLVVGDELWLMTFKGAFVRRPSGWAPVEDCGPGTVVGVDVLDAHRALLRCGDGRVVTRGKSRPLSCEPPPSVRQTKGSWDALVLGGRPELWLFDGSSATLVQSHYEGPTWTCGASGPLRLTRVPR